MHTKKILISFSLFLLISFSPCIHASDDEFLSSLIQHLALVASDHKAHRENPVPIIGIGGCPGVGKTYLASVLADELKKKGVSFYILPLDHFNLSSADRKKIGTEWDLRHLKHQELHTVLDQIRTGEKHLTKPTYDQFTGEVGLEAFDLSNVDLILFEGLYALCSHEPINYYQYCLFGIYLDADEVDVYTWKWERDQRKTVPRTKEQFEKHMAVLIEEFHKNICYTKNNALYLIKKGGNHCYQMSFALGKIAA